MLDVTAEATGKASWRRSSAPGRLDGLVNAAGIAHLGTIEDTDYATWRRVLAVNLDGTFLGCKHALALLKRGGGAIVNLSSISGIVRRPQSRGLQCLQGRRAAADEVGRAPRRAPQAAGALQLGASGVSRRADGGGHSRADRPAGIARGQLARDIPLGRLGEPAEVAELCVYLLSDESRFVTGAEFAIDGGLDRALTVIAPAADDRASGRRGASSPAAP